MFTVVLGRGEGRTVVVYGKEKTRKHKGEYRNKSTWCRRERELTNETPPAVTGPPPNILHRHVRAANTSRNVWKTNPIFGRIHTIVSFSPKTRRAPPQPGPVHRRRLKYPQPSKEPGTRFSPAGRRLISI